MNALLSKLNRVLGIRPQPAAPAPGLGKKGMSTNNKYALIAVGVLASIGLALAGLRTVTSGLQSQRVTPGDPNLNRTVSTKEGKSSVVDSYESEINEKNLNGDNVSASVKYQSGKWKYRPSGRETARSIADTSQSVKTPVVPVAALAPKKEKPKVVQKIVYVSPRKKKVEVRNEDPFNTVHVGTTAAFETSPTAPAVDNSADVESVRMIPACVYGNQTLRSGGKARFRVTETVRFQGVHIPRNTIFTATAYVGSGRMQFMVPAQVVAGQRLPVDLLCVDADMQAGITYNYDYVEDNMRQVGSSTTNDVADEVTRTLPYGSVARVGATAVRGLTQAVTMGKRQKSTAQVLIQDGYRVFFKSSKS